MTTVPIKAVRRVAHIVIKPGDSKPQSFTLLDKERDEISGEVCPISFQITNYGVLGPHDGFGCYLLKEVWHDSDTVPLTMKEDPEFKASCVLSTDDKTSRVVELLNNIRSTNPEHHKVASTLSDAKGIDPIDKYQSVNHTTNIARFLISKLDSFYSDKTQTLVQKNDPFFTFLTGYLYLNPREKPVSRDVSIIELTRTQLTSIWKEYMTSLERVTGNNTNGAQYLPVDKLQLRIAPLSPGEDYFGDELTDEDKHALKTYCSDDDNSDNDNDYGLHKHHDQDKVRVYVEFFLRYATHY